MAIIQTLEGKSAVGNLDGTRKEVGGTRNEQSQISRKEPRPQPQPQRQHYGYGYSYAYAYQGYMWSGDSDEEDEVVENTGCRGCSCCPCLRFNTPAGSFSCFSRRRGGVRHSMDRLLFARIAVGCLQIYD